MNRADGSGVLLGFVESLAAIETAWLLLDAGLEVVSFSRAGVRPPLARDGRVRNYEIVSPQHDAHAAGESLRELIAKVNPAVVLPLDDDALWLCDRLWATGVTLPALAGPRGPQAQLALDKSRQLELAGSVGLAVPPTVVCCPDRPVELDRLTTEGPWIVKPALAAAVENGRLTRGGPHRVETRAAVAALVADSTATMLVQPVLRGTGEGLFGFAHAGGVTGWSAHRRIRTKDPGGSGSSACRSIDVDPAMVERAGAMIAKSGWRGLFMLEFLRDDAGTPWWMELNGRTWGSMVLARHRGVPYPVWAVRAALDPAYVPPEPAPAPHVVARHLGREILHVAVVLRGPPDAVTGESWPTRPAALRALLTWRRGERLYNYRRDHRRVFLSDTWQTVLSVLPGRVRRLVHRTRRR